MRRAAFVLACAGLAEALYFYVSEGAPRCFIEDVPPETLVVGTYKNPDLVTFGSPGFTGVVSLLGWLGHRWGFGRHNRCASLSHSLLQGLRAEVKDPQGYPLTSKQLDTQGRFAFTTTVGGEYQLCFSANSTRWFGQPKKFRLDLKIDIGEMGIDYTEVAKKEHLTNLEVEVRLGA